jgi:hypothetical protein
MDIEIVVRGSFDEAVSEDLRMLRDLLAQSDVPVSSTVLTIARRKEPITIGLAAAGLAISVVGVVISALSLWLSQRPRYSVTVQCGNRSYTLANLRKGQVEEIVRELKAAASDQPLLVWLDHE